MRVGEDPWLGARNNYKHLGPLLQFLKSRNIIHLQDIQLGDPRPRGWAGWKDATVHGIPVDLHEEWDSISQLCKKFITLEEESDDSLCWSLNPKDGSFKVKLGYKAWQEERLGGQPKW